MTADLPQSSVDKLREKIANALMVWMLADKAKAMVESEGFSVVNAPTDAILAIVTAEIGAAEIAALKAARDDMRGISFEHGDKVNGNHDFMRGISAARELLADRIRNHFGIGESSK